MHRQKLKIGDRHTCRWSNLIIMTLYLFAGMAAPAALAAPAEAKDLTELSIEDLMAVEVTTTVARKAQRVTETAAAVFVITPEDIRRSGVTSIPEALRMVPGIEVARIDANKWAISSRGFNGSFANKLLVLMDGRTLYSPMYSGVYWDVQDTLLEDVARIEVIRGPGASLWGANAVNGVINIITKPASETQGGLITGGAGTEEKGFGALRYGGTIGNSAHYRAYGKYFERDNGRSIDGQTAEDHWHVARGGGRIDWEPSAKSTLTVQGDYYDGNAGSKGYWPTFDPPYVQPFTEQIPISGGNLLSRWQRTLSATSDFILQTYYDHTRRIYPILDETRDTFDLDFQHRFQLGRRQEWMWGVGYRLTQADTTDSEVVSLRYDDRRDQLFSFFTQDDISLVPEKVSLLIGTKIEKNDYTGFEFQPNARLLWTPDSRQTFWAAVSRAVRTPSQAEHDVRLLQIVQPGPPDTAIYFYGSPGFESEELIAYEVGYRYFSLEKYSLDLALFYNQYDNLRTIELGSPFIEGSPPHVVQPFIVGNKLQGNTYGAELALEYRPLGWWRLQGAYTYLQMHLKPDADSTDVTSQNAEGESPRQQLSLRSSMDLAKNWELDLWARYVAELPAQNIAGYLTMDARLGWRPTPHLEFSVVGQNLLNNAHQEFDPEILDLTPTQVERSVYGKATWRF